ncbi:glycosyltransferase family 2 protein [Lactococcus cremoris]
MPKVSVIVPVYNVEKLLERCLNSVLNQSFQDFELLLIDDGSKDSSGQICDNYAKKDQRVRVWHIPNGGQSAARNLGIDNVYGTYIAFIDSDDFVELDYLEQLYQPMVEYEADVVSCRYIAYSKERDEEVKKIIQENQAKVYHFRTNHDVMQDFLEKEFKDDRNFPWESYANLYKTELLGEIRFEVGREFEDNFFNYQYFKKVQKAIATTYIGYYYYANPTSKTRITFYEKQFDLIQQERLIIEDVKIKYPEFIDLEANNLALKYCWLYGKIFGDIRFSNFSVSKKNIRIIQSLYKYKIIKNANAFYL